jgi:hypothetical protein
MTFKEQYERFSERAFTFHFVPLCSGMVFADADASALALSQ